MLFNSRYYFGVFFYLFLEWIVMEMMVMLNNNSILWAKHSDWVCIFIQWFDFKHIRVRVHICVHDLYIAPKSNDAVDLGSDSRLRNWEISREDSNWRIRIETPLRSILFVVIRKLMLPGFSFIYWMLFTRVSRDTIKIIQLPSVLDTRRKSHLHVLYAVIVRRCCI